MNKIKYLFLIGILILLLGTNSLSFAASEQIADSNISFDCSLSVPVSGSNRTDFFSFIQSIVSTSKTYKLDTTTISGQLTAQELQKLNSLTADNKLVLLIVKVEGSFDLANINNLKSVEGLAFAGSNKSFTNLSELKKLPKLKALSLDSANLSDQNEAAIKDIISHSASTQFESLDLSGNSFQDSVIDRIKNEWTSKGKNISKLIF